MRYFIFILILCLVSCDSEKKPVEAKAEQKVSSTETIQPEVNERPEVDVKVAWRREFPNGEHYRYVHDYISVSPELTINVLNTLGASSSTEPELLVNDVESPRLKVESKVYHLHTSKIIDPESKETYYSEGLYKELYAEWLQYIVEVEAEENE
ncbi:hypothetical protein LNTAR_23014 [Lentisphaera araneosa HTCC2155]|jgi:hypothetical protein|uniref:Uncharacterized protein n=1 Tax=Lentisphaera araneosa HTCC2155 TaxID=313628 RepID=A6DGJ4_9BACT|nr:hypothetical protein [Lentisphaera araneosa]EDM29311.1 hypothetical protein LNTAR_23014 [Lentisphaera araneosa HTCC2155]